MATVTKGSREEAEQRVRNGFLIHATVYAAVNSGLGVMYFSRDPDSYWYYWMLGGWGVGLLLHGGLAFGTSRGVDRVMHRRQTK